MDKKQFNDFIERLRYHNKGEGVDDHCTSNPLFVVQTKRRIYGISDDYTDKWGWIDNCETEIESQHLKEWLTKNTDLSLSDIDDIDLEFDDEIKVHDNLTLNKVGYIEQWEYVNAHLTKEGAEAFIKRKSHDYPKLRIFADSQYWCLEFNEIIDGLLSGEIGIIDEDRN